MSSTWAKGGRVSVLFYIVPDSPAPDILYLQISYLHDMAFLCTTLLKKRPEASRSRRG